MLTFFLIIWQTRYKQFAFVADSSLRTATNNLANWLKLSNKPNEFPISTSALPTKLTVRILFNICGFFLFYIGKFEREKWIKFSQFSLHVYPEIGWWPHLEFIAGNFSTRRGIIWKWALERNGWKIVQGCIYAISTCAAGPVWCDINRPRW